VFDLLLTGGALLDGTGAPARPADIGVRGDRIVAVGAPGTLGTTAEVHLDATDLVVAPGFVDVHTHYDAQVFWDAACTPSCLHGVTTVFAGNCGFSIAPLPDDGEYLMRLLARVEGIPLEALAAGVPWDWRSFAEYLAAVESRGTAVNFGAMAGHSALRRTVLGARSGATDLEPAELDALRAALRDALEAGAIGFSSSWAASHVDGAGDPVPSRAASADELVALCGELAPFAGAQVEFIAANGPFEERHVEVMTRMALAAGAPLNWNVLIPRDAATVDGRLRASDHARAQGATVVALSYPDVIRSRVSFLSSAFDVLPGWAAVMALAPDAKLAALRDPEVRARLRAGADEAVPSGMPTARYAQFTVSETVNPAHAAYVGRTIAELAVELGREPFDVLCDLVVADDLRTGFVPPPPASDAEGWRLRKATWTDPRVIIGASDGGAHLDILTTYDYPVRYLALAREHDELTLAEVVRQLTDVPASLYGLRDRGRVREGAYADLVVFDPRTVDTGPVQWRTDLPAGAARLYSEPTGIAHVVVNGREIVRHGALTGARPGTVLRRGRDTDHTAART
jgi:N-acyl-D-aspartate/D-glutamate deacylase